MCILSKLNFNVNIPVIPYNPIKVIACSSHSAAVFGFTGYIANICSRINISLLTILLIGHQQLKLKGCDEMAENYVDEKKETFGIGHFFIRWVVGAIVLAITAFLTPGFSISGIWSLILASLVLAGLDYLVSKVVGVNATPFGRGIIGFILAAAIIFITKYIVPGYDVTVLGAIIGALIYGVIDLIIPGRAM